jgi:MFS family permease
MTPSIYQFITSPSSIPEELKNDEDSSRFWPGLGGSDTDYAWVLVSQPIFEVATIPLTVAALHRLPFSFILYIFAGLSALGGAMYALANSVWIAFAGRGLMGVGIAFGASTIHAYLGEMGTVMDDIREKQGKSPRKFILYIAFSFTLNGGMVIPTVLNSIMANFKDLNPYRWPGWSITALSITLALIVLFFFTETRSISCSNISRMSCSCLNGLKLSAQLKSKWKMRFLVSFIQFCVVCV